MKERRAANALLGMAAGEALANLLRHDEKGISILLKEERLPQPQVDFGCKPENAPMPGLHGYCTQIALLMRAQFISRNELTPRDSIESLQKEITTAIDVFRQTDPLITAVHSGEKLKSPSLAAAIWLNAPCIEFDRYEDLIPWVIKWMQSLTTNPFSISCGVDFTLLVWALSRGMERDDAVDIMQNWRDSSQAMQSPIPDKHWWILQKAFSIRLEYGKKELLDFLDAAIGQDEAQSVDTVAFYTEAISSGLSARNYRDVMEVISKQNTSRSLFGAFCGSAAALSGTTPPNWIRDALPAYNHILSAEEWTIDFERHLTEAQTEYRKRLPLKKQKKRRHKRSKNRDSGQMTLFK